MKKIGVLLVAVFMLAFFALSTGAVDSATQVDRSFIQNLLEGKTQQTVQDDNHKHEYTKYVVAPSCTEKGYTAYVCDCGYAYVDDYVDKIAHKYESQIIKPATHYEEGEEKFTCECGNSYTAVIDKTPHTYSTIVIPPTCLAPSYTTYTCDECGYSYTSDYKEPMAHSYVITDVIVEHTCDKDSYAIYTCVCGESYMDIYIPATGHNYEGQTCVNCGRTCSCNCHKTGFMGVIWKIILFFNKLFKTNQECHCGVIHY